MVPAWMGSRESPLLSYRLQNFHCILTWERAQTRNQTLGTVTRALNPTHESSKYMTVSPPPPKAPPLNIIRQRKTGPIQSIEIRIVSEISAWSQKTMEWWPPSLVLADSACQGAATTMEAHTLEPMLCNERRHRDEKPAQHSWISQLEKAHGQ